MNHTDDRTEHAEPAPKVSVILPVYNAEKFLREAVDSILNQTFRDFELLLINDGSTDRSAEIIEQYRSSPLVRIFHKKNEGVTKTLNFGLSQARGQYIARMDADDISMPERFLLQTQYLDSHPQTGLLGSRIRQYGEDGRFIQDLDVELADEELQRVMIRHCRIAHPTVMMRKAVIDAVGPYDESPWAHTVEDYDLWLRIAERFKIANLPQYLVHYRVYSKSVSMTNREINRRGARECIRRALERRRRRPDMILSLLAAHKESGGRHRTLDSGELKIRRTMAGEYLELYCTRPWEPVLSCQTFAHFCHLFEICDIHTPQDILECGCKGIVPEEIDGILRWCRLERAVPAAMRSMLRPAGYALTRICSSTCRRCP